MIRGKVGDWEWQLRPQCVELSRGELGDPGYVWLAFRRSMVVELEMNLRAEEVEDGGDQEGVVMVRTAAGVEGGWSAIGTRAEVEEFCRAVGNWLAP